MPRSGSAWFPESGAATPALPLLLLCCGLAPIGCCSAAAADAGGHHAAPPPAPFPGPPAVPSRGCGKLLPFPVDAPLDLNVPVADPILFNKFREYYLALPPGYNNTQPLPLVLSFHGFYDEAIDMQKTDKLMYMARTESPFIVVHPQGLMDTGTHQPQKPYPQRTWNCGGTVGSPGPLGPTCDTANRTSTWGVYPCYLTCQNPLHGGCKDTWYGKTPFLSLFCVKRTIYQDRLGMNTGKVEGNAFCCSSSSTCANDTLFVETLLDELEETLCIDRRRIHATGISNGGMMAYQTGAKTIHDDPPFFIVCAVFLMKTIILPRQARDKLCKQGKLTK